LSTQTHPRNRPYPTEPIIIATRKRPAGGTVVASVLAGGAAAMVLTLVVFGGATEAVITGAMLLGFAFGWALLATLTVRRTRQSQRWAVVPAVVMGATGTMLSLSTPGNQTLTVLNWVWPPVTVALAGWMFVRMRGSMKGAARLLLSPVIAVLVLASIGATYDNVARTLEQGVAAPGKLYDVGGHRLHLDCQGTGSPTVVLSNGLGEVSASWARITVPLAGTTRVCAYDRAGQGWSDDAAIPRDGVQSARELHTLLAEAREHGPYVLVGHSTGGTYAMTYAAQYPAQVAGLVLLDSSSPEQFTRIPAYPVQYEMILRRAYALLPTLSRLGVGRLVPTTSHLEATDAARVAAITSGTRSYRNFRDEVSAIPDVFEQAQALSSLGDKPLAVITASENSVGIDGWTGAQDQLAGLSDNALHRTVESTHAGLLEDAGPSADSVRAIADVVSAVRSGDAVPTR
jgi:pimeloyl-ACP methyl ester carboxylesterase